MTESLTMRRSSWLLTAKCFDAVATPSDWMPRTYAAARRPASSGSSEKYSKFRPPSGLLLMLRPGPRRTPTPCDDASLPRATPISVASSSSQLLATVAPVGKQVASSEPWMPR